MGSSKHHFKTTSTVSGFGVRFLNGLYNGLYPGLYGLYDGLYVSIVMGRDMGRCLCGGLDAVGLWGSLLLAGCVSTSVS